MKKKKPIILALLLIVALFLERMCFVVTVYKTQGYSYVSILGVMFLKALLDYVIALIKRKKHKRKLY